MGCAVLFTLSWRTAGTPPPHLCPPPPPPTLAFLLSLMESLLSFFLDVLFSFLSCFGCLVLQAGGMVRQRDGDHSPSARRKSRCCCSWSHFAGSAYSACVARIHVHGLGWREILDHNRKGRA